MKKLIMIVAVAMLAGCGSGSGLSTSDAPAQQQAVQKTSAVDGSWVSYYTEPSGYKTPLNQLSLKNGLVQLNEWNTYSNSEDSGTFSVSGNTLALHYDKWTVCPRPQNSNVMAASPCSYNSINRAELYTFTVSGKTLTLTDTAGKITVFTR